MSKFFYWQNPVTEMTIEDQILMNVVSGVLANPRIDEKTPPSLVVEWAMGITDEILNIRYGNRGDDRTGEEVIADREKRLIDRFKE